MSNGPKKITPQRVRFWLDGGERWGEITTVDNEGGRAEGWELKQSYEHKELPRPPWYSFSPSSLSWWQKTYEIQKTTFTLQVYQNHWTKPKNYQHFRDEQHALEHIIDKAMGGSPLHVKALITLGLSDPDAYGHWIPLLKAIWIDA